MRPNLVIATRNVLPRECDVNDDGDDGDDGDDEGGGEREEGEERKEEEEEEAYLNLLPTGMQLLKEKKQRQNTTRRHRKLDRWRGGRLLPLRLPQLLHYAVTLFLAAILLGIVVVYRPGTRGREVTVSYVHLSLPTHPSSFSCPPHSLIH